MQQAKYLKEEIIYAPGLASETSQAGHESLHLSISELMPANIQKTRRGGRRLADYCNP